jgi:polyether ionophore transport system permease protein
MNVAAVAVRSAVRPKDGTPRWVITRHVAWSALRWAVVWGIVFGLFVFTTIQAFLKGYPTAAERLQLAHSMQAFEILIGQGHHLETVGGFTSWRLMTTTAIIGAIWAVRTSTGLLRGEEDEGRWELFLAGPTTPRRATLEAVFGLGSALLVMFAITAAFTLIAGRLPGARFPFDLSLLFALSIVASAAMFLAVGALFSQLAATAGQASMLSFALLGLSFVLRVTADANSGLGWLRWTSPLGWIEELRPLRDPQLVALLPMAALIVVCSVLTVVLAGRRDLNASVLRERDSGPGSTRWLTGPTGLAIRLARNSALVWLIAIGGDALLLGSVTRSATGVLSTGSPTVAAALGRLGIRQAAEGYLGLIFLMASVVVALAAASQLAAMRDEEATGRIDNMLVRPVSRMQWLAARVGVALGVVVLLGLMAGACAWIGSANQHTGASPLTLVLAGLNITPPAIFVLGAGTLVFGILPQLTAAAGYGIVAWSFLLNLVGALVKNADWLKDSSLFSHIALSPAVKPDWAADAIMVVFGLAFAVAGAAMFQRRDITYT